MHDKILVYVTTSVTTLRYQNLNRNEKCKNINHIKIAYKKVSRSQVKAQGHYSLKIRGGMYGIYAPKLIQFLDHSDWASFQILILCLPKLPKGYYFQCTLMKFV